MPISKAKKKAKTKRKEFKNRLKCEKEATDERKKLKAEINRRFSSGQKTIHLPEDDYFNDGSFDKEDFDIFSQLAERMVFFKLEQVLSKTSCDGTFTIIESLISNLYSKDKIEDILHRFEGYGGYCDCEILDNVRDKMYQYDESFLLDTEYDNFF